MYFLILSGRTKRNANVLNIRSFNFGAEKFKGSMQQVYYNNRELTGLSYRTNIDPVISTVRKKRLNEW